MKKRECAIVQDLLVLYEGGMLQEESMQMIEEHIRGCEECMRIYENTDKELPVSGSEGEASEKEQEDAVQEMGFREKTPWEWNAVECNQVSVVFATSRQGVLEESGEKITQRCSEISYYGKTKEDKLVLWKRGQTVKTAPEDIERRAIEGYVRDGQIGKAIRECEKLGWNSDEEIARICQKDNDIRHIYDGTSGAENVVFQRDYATVLINEW